MAHYSPKDNSHLNYLLTGFYYPTALAGITYYTLEIADGNYPDELAFEKHRSQSFRTANNRLTVELPSFGRDYTWMVVYHSSNGGEVKSALRHFCTQPLPDEQHGPVRMMVTSRAKKYSGAYVFCDASRKLYNMKGVPVWFMPPIKDADPAKFEVRDLKISPAGSITFLSTEGQYEINYDGEVLWTAPKNETANQTGEGNFHHEFCKLHNGHFMLLGTELICWNKCNAGICDSNSLSAAHIADSNHAMIPFCTLLEYDQAGKLVWKWRSVNYFKKSDIFNHMGEGKLMNLDAHSNAFYFDEINSKIYISFKDISRIVAISYPGGNAINEYGETFLAGFPEKINELFSEQHALKKSMTGEIYLLDNNLSHESTTPSIVIFREPTDNSNHLKKIWSMNCPTGDATYPGTIIKMPRHGGNIVELPDSAFFVAMCTPYSNLFITDKRRQILWAATPQRYDSQKKKWVALTSYRSSIVTEEKDIERLIWNNKNETGIMTAPIQKI